MPVRKCAICKMEIPNKTFDELIDLGYVKMQFAGNKKLGRKALWFCPEHSQNEVVRYVFGPHFKNKGLPPQMPLTRSEAVEF